MRPQIVARLMIALFLGMLFPVSGSDLDVIGVSLLRLKDSGLVGSGISVAHPEAPESGAASWQVNPASVGQPAALFTWLATNGSATNFPNSIGSESSHAVAVANIFYGATAGVAPGVWHVDNYEGEFFYSLVSASSPIQGKVVNQSFIFDTNQQQEVDRVYDEYSAQNGTLFCSAVGNGGPIYAPGSGYNGIGVGVYGAPSSTGPTLDNGRCKPDLVAPGGYTSFSTPYVAGAAAVLLQAAARGDGGTNIAGAGDLRTIKALLLNGAVKPSDWTHSSSAPLDSRYGAGVLNVFNSYNQLAGGVIVPAESTTVSAGNPHPPGSNTNAIWSRAGWALQSLANSVPLDAVHHFYFDSRTNRNLTLTATLVWNRQAGQSAINDLDLFLYDRVNGNLVAASTSRVDNVEHVYVPMLQPGKYDLQVLKRGFSGRVTSAETYALAFETFNVPLTTGRAGENVLVSWPAYPAGFRLQVTSNLGLPGSWVNLSTPAMVVNNSNQVIVSISSPKTYFRLQR